MLKVVIMAGGQGSRLWPLSHPKRPKPFLKLFSGKSLFELTVERFQSDVHVIVPKNLEHLVHEQAPRTKIVIEEKSTGTANAVHSALKELMESENDQFCFVPADHMVEDIDRFKQGLEKALECRNSITLLSVKPENFDPSYGYILPSQNGVKFVEKPTSPFWGSGGFWNTGMFVFTAGLFLSEMEKYARFPLVGSLDKVLIEKTKRLRVVELETGWSDLGTWERLIAYFEKSWLDKIKK